MEKINRESIREAARVLYGAGFRGISFNNLIKCILGSTEEIEGILKNQNNHSPTEKENKMHEEFSKYGTPAIKLVEECSELIQVVCKGERFGYDDKNPLIENAPPNRHRIADEISDVENALETFKKWLNELPKDIRRKD
jgi:hypothetical protein